MNIYRYSSWNRKTIIDQLRGGKMILSSAFILLQLHMISNVASLTTNLGPIPYIPPFHCPIKCQCHQKNIDCSKRDLTFVPPLDPYSEIAELQSNRIQRITKYTFRSLVNIKKLDLSNNQISHIDPESFWYCHQLQELKLQYNELKEFPLFLPGNSMALLYLQHNKITHLVPMAVTPLVNLQTLDISFNNLTQLVPGTFINNSQLRQLFLNNNHIIHLHQGYFDQLESLEWLKLSKNRLYNLPDAIFLKLSKLKYLELNRNKLVEIRSLTFHGLKSLEVLKMRRNDISTLKDGAFWGLSSIQNLQLDFNNIEGVAKQWLYGLAHLEKLSLTYNMIRKFEPEGWESCPNLVELDLSGNKINHLPAQSFNELQHLKSLNLAYNEIENMDVETFVGMKNMEELKLNDNRIHAALEEEKQEEEELSEAFVDTTAYVEKVSPLNLFEPLINLKTLLLSNNGIRSLASKCFTGLKSLVYLDLGSNRILSIRNDTFAPLDSIKEIVINTSNLICDCGLSWLPAWLSQKPSPVTKPSSSLVCAQPTNLAGLDFLAHHPDTHNATTTTNMDIDLTCPTSDPLRSFAPIISRHGPPKVEFVQGSLRSTLVCEVIVAYDQSADYDASVGAVRITWKKDDVSIVPYLAHDQKMTVTTADIPYHGATEPKNNVPIRSVLSEVLGGKDADPPTFYVIQHSTIDNVVVDREKHVPFEAGNYLFNLTADDVLVKSKIVNKSFTQPSTLITMPVRRVRKTISIIRFGDDRIGITDSHAGAYKCVAAKGGAGGGSASSPRTRLTVSIAPYFTVTPSPTNKRVRVGATLRLECGAQGRPRPQVAWQKDGGRDDFPAARERRMRVMHPADAHFFITEVKPTDAGVYTCRARNSAGVSSVNATVTVLEIPYLTKPMSDKVVTEGQTVVIECMADGTPKPSVTWFKEERLIDKSNDRYFFAADNQLLIIVRTEVSDAGLFECVMQNTLGNVRGLSKLTVYPSDFQGQPQPSSQEMATFLLNEKGLNQRDKALVSDYIHRISRNSLNPSISNAASQILDSRSNDKNRREKMKLSESLVKEDDPYLLIRPKNAVKISQVGTSMPIKWGKSAQNSADSKNKFDRKGEDGSPRGSNFGQGESAMLEIVILAVVGCAVFTSVLWVALIYKTRKRNTVMSRPNGRRNFFMLSTRLLLKGQHPCHKQNDQNYDDINNHVSSNTDKFECKTFGRREGKFLRCQRLGHTWGTPTTYLLIDQTVENDAPKTGEGEKCHQNLGVGQNEYTTAATLRPYSPNCYDEHHNEDETLEQDYMAIKFNGPVKSCDLSRRSSIATSCEEDVQASKNCQKSPYPPYDNAHNDIKDCAYQIIDPSGHCDSRDSSGVKYDEQAKSKAPNPIYNLKRDRYSSISYSDCNKSFSTFLPPPLSKTKSPHEGDVRFVGDKRCHTNIPIPSPHPPVINVKEFRISRDNDHFDGCSNNSTLEEYDSGLPNPSSAIQSSSLSSCESYTSLPTIHKSHSYPLKIPHNPHNIPESKEQNLNMKYVVS